MRRGAAHRAPQQPGLHRLRPVRARILRHLLPPGRLSSIFFTVTKYFPRCQADPQAFQLSGLQGDNVPVPVNGEAACHDDYLYIPRGQHLDDVTQKYTEERYGSQQFYNKKPNHCPTKQKYFSPRKI